MAVQPIPEGYRTITPYLCVDNGSAAIEFYQRAFGAKETVRMAGPGDSIMHAELEIGDSKIGLSDPFPQGLTKPPNELGGTSVSILVYVEDTDALYKQAIDAGATSLGEPTDMFWGDRFGSVQDPFGHSWTIATHIEDVSPEELETRSQQWQEQMAGMASQQA
jgi:PhnB protein